MLRTMKCGTSAVFKTVIPKKISLFVEYFLAQNCAKNSNSSLDIPFLFH